MTSRISNDATRASSEAMPNHRSEGATRPVKAGEAADLVGRAFNLNELVFEAAENIGDSAVRAAFLTGISIVSENLREALEILCPKQGERA